MGNYKKAVKKGGVTKHQAKPNAKGRPPTKKEKEKEKEKESSLKETSQKSKASQKTEKNDRNKAVTQRTAPESSVKVTTKPVNEKEVPVEAPLVVKLAGPEVPITRKELSAATQKKLKLADDLQAVEKQVRLEQSSCICI